MTLRQSLLLHVAEKNDAPDVLGQLCSQLLAGSLHFYLNDAVKEGGP